MLRIVRITVSSVQTDTLLAHVRQIPGIVALQVQRGAALQPQGDVVTVEIANRGLAPLMQLLRQPGMAAGFSTSEPASVVSPQLKGALAQETSETTWEEMETVISKESNMTVITG